VFLVIVPDTSFLVSLYFSSDINHQQALKLAEENKNEIMLLSDIILFETLTVLLYKEGLQLCNIVYNHLMQNKNVRFFHFTDQEKDEIIKVFFSQTNSKLSLPDISVLYLTNKSKSKVLAFDEDILNKIKT